MPEVNTDNMLSQMKKGALELCILSIVQRGEAYPADIAQELRDNGMPVLEGTLYPLLTRMKNQGYLSYRWVESSSGPPRKYFEITKEGKKFLQSLITVWTEFTESVSKIAQLKN